MQLLFWYLSKKEILVVLLCSRNRILFKGKTNSVRYIWAKNPELTIKHPSESYSLLVILGGQKCVDVRG